MGRRNNSRLSFIHADAFEPLHAEDFALRELYLSGCELNYLPEDLMPGKQNWANLEVVGEDYLRVCVMTGLRVQATHKTSNRFRH